MSFVGEIQRRKIFQVAAVYLVVAWLIMQVVDVINEPLSLPDWFDTVVILLLAIGFPIAVVLSWAFDLTPEGVVRDVGEGKPNERDSRRVEYTLIGLLVLALGFMFVDNYVLDESSQTAEVQPTTAISGSIAANPNPLVIQDQREVLPNSVAVLLCDNLSPDPDDAYFAASIHEEILNQLVKIRALNVIARTSVLPYADALLSVPEIANELNVASVMECSVRFAGDAIMVTAQLIDPETNTHLWSDTYPGDLTDLSTVFSMQADIAMNIANALEAEFSLAEQERIEQVPTSSPAAYALYLQALELSAGDDSLLSVQFLDRALELDPEFAVAHGLKALRLVLRGRIDPVLEPDRADRVQEAVERALALDPDLASAHAALGALHTLNWRWADAERAYERAFQSNPSDTAVLAAYGSFRRDVGQYPEAVQLFERAAELDPNASRTQLGISYRYAKNYDAAAVAFGQAIDVDPANAAAYTHLGLTEITRGNLDEAIRQLSIGEQLWGENIPSTRLAQTALGYARTNRPQEVQRIFNVLQERERTNGDSVGNDSWTMMYVALGDYDQALQYLEALVSASAGGEWLMGQVKANDLNDPVLEEPRWQEMRSRLGAL